MHWIGQGPSKARLNKVVGKIKISFLQVSEHRPLSQLSVYWLVYLYPTNIMITRDRGKAVTTGTGSKHFWVTLETSAGHTCWQSGHRELATDSTSLPIPEPPQVCTDFQPVLIICTPTSDCDVIIRKLLDSILIYPGSQHRHTKDLAEHTGHFLSVRLPTIRMTYPQRCFKHTIQ
jgi:hypothetical protein